MILPVAAWSSVLELVEAAARLLPTQLSLDALMRAMQSKSQGNRLKPVADSLENVGFVSKGDRKYDHPTRAGLA